MGWDELIAAMGKRRALLVAGKVCSVKAMITLTLAAGLAIPITADLSFAPTQQPVISGGTVTRTLRGRRRGGAGSQREIWGPEAQPVTPIDPPFDVRARSRARAGGDSSRGKPRRPKLHLTVWSGATCPPYAHAEDLFRARRAFQTPMSVARRVRFHYEVLFPEGP